MADDKKKVMSIAIMPELHEKVKKYAKRKGISASAYIGDLIEKALKLNIDDDPMVVGKPIDEEITPVVLKMPSVLKGDKVALQEWLDIQTSGILRMLGGLE